MSTNRLSRISRQFVLAAIVVVACSFGSNLFAQQTQLAVRVSPGSTRIAVELVTAPTGSWSFIDSYAGIVGLGRRVERFTALDESGAEVQLIQAAPGQYKSATPVTRVRYEIDLHPVSRGASFSTLSWMDKERGVLMPLDLLPVPADGSRLPRDHPKIHFYLPDAWKVSSGELKLSPDEYAIADVSRAVFALGSNLRTAQTNAAGLALNFVTSSDWAFSDAEVLELAQQVLKAHRQTFGSFPAQTATFILFPFPLAVAMSQWAAETRGTTVTLIMGKLPSKVAALAQLSTPVTHEFFHLWVPNALELSGNYDWFYEGFTVYQASQTALKLGLLTFPEFLNSIARAYDSSKTETNSSLIEASNRRFTAGLNSVYAKSQLVAFIYDLRLRDRSRNKKSLADAYRKLLSAKSGGGRAGDGNQVVESLLSEELGSDDFVGRFIENPVSIDLPTELAPFGLKVDSSGFRTQISVREGLTKQQRDLLAELGYNAATHAPR